MDTLIFDVTIDEDGRYVAQARGSGIATDGATWEELKTEVQDLIDCHFDDGLKPAKFQLMHVEELAVA